MVDEKSVYKSFSQKYKKVEDLEGLTDLNLTPREGFELKQIYDLNEIGSRLTIILRIDLSNNYLSKLHLKSIPNLQKLFARQNMINECNLVLPRLKILDLSINLLKEIPPLGNTPELAELDLSKNLIEKVTANDLLPIKKTLEVIKISFNRIQFASINDFISFIDGIKFFQIKELSIEGNEFTRSNQILSNSYKTLIVLSLKNLHKLNGEPRVGLNDLVNEEEIKQQMLHEEVYLNRTKKAFYSSFSQVYSDVTAMEKMTKLELNPFKSFFLKSIDDMLEYSKAFTQLIYLNVSENLLTQLTIGKDDDDFPSLQIIKASKNNIGKIRLNHLVSLAKLDLSYNQLKEMPNLNGITGPMQAILLSHNKIAAIECNKIALLTFITDLNLAGNLIDFKDKDAIGLVFTSEMEKGAEDNANPSARSNSHCNANTNGKDKRKKKSSMLTQPSNMQFASLGTFQLLTSLNVEDNPFCANLSLLNTFALELAKEFDVNKFQLNGVSLKLLIRQLDELEQKSKFKGPPPVEEADRKGRPDGMESKFASLNNILERLISFNGNNQLLYFEFLSELNTSHDDTQQECGDLLSLRQTYEAFLMNCNELISLNPNYENQILKALSQLALFPKYNICKYTLDYLKMYVASNEKKKILIKSIIENIIIKSLQTNDSIPLDIISELLSFFKDTSISSNLLYKSLILNIIRYIAQNDQNVKNLEGKKAKDFLNSLHFVLNYLQAEGEMQNDPNAAPQGESKDLYENDSLNSSELSFDPDIDRTNDALIYDVLYEEKIVSVLRTDFVLESANTELSLANVMRACEVYYECFNLNKFNPIPVFGYDLLKKISMDHSLVMLQMCSPSDRKYFEFIIYCYVFLNIFKVAHSLITDVKQFFAKVPLPDEDVDLKGEKLFKLITLLNKLISTFQLKKYPFNYMLRSCDVESILDALDSFISPVLLEKKETVSYDQLIARYIFDQPVISPNLSASVKSFYHNFPIFFECIGTLIAFLPESLYFKKIESHVLEKYYAILTSPKVDPYILCGTCSLMNKIISSNYFMQNDLNMSTIFSRVKNFRNLLHFIDYTNDQYRNVVDSLLTEENFEAGSDNPYDFNVISLQSLFDYFLSIINLFVTISKLGLGTSKIANGIIEDLKERRMYDILGNCLKIVKNDEIRKRAIECFFCVDHKSITNENIILIIDIVSKYSSIVEGEIEYIISIIFLTLNNKLSSMIGSIDANTFSSMKLAVNAAITFLCQNTERFAGEKELEEKNTLSPSLMIFLFTASRSPGLFSDLFEDIESSFTLFKRIITNDFTFLNEENYIPIQIERTHFGFYLPILFETMEGFNCLQTYSYPFLRILIKIADILCKCDEFSFEILKFKGIEKLFHTLRRHMNSRFFQITQNETKDWYSFQTNGQRKRPKLSPRLQAKTEEDTSFEFVVKEDGNDREDLYLTILNSRIAETVPFDVNEFYPEQYPEMSVKELIAQHANFLITFPNLLVFLLGKKTNLLDDSISKQLAVKYYKPIVDSEKILQLFEHYKANGKINTIIGEIKHFESEIPFSNPLSKAAINKLKTVNIDSLLKVSNLISFTTQAKSESVVNEYLTFENDIIKFELYGLSAEAKRRKRDEDVNNPHLRSLIINALLRCVYALLISPSHVIRRDFIEYLFIGNKYKEILLFANTARFYQNYNLYTIIEEVFSAKNLPTLITACSYSHIKEQSSNKKMKVLNAIIFSSSHSTNKDHEAKRNETELFHQFLITATYLEKEIKLKAHLAKDNFLFLYTLEMCVYAFINSYFQINFRVIDTYFRSLFITRRLCLTEHYHMIFSLREQMNFHSIEAFNTLKELKRTYIKYQNDFLNHGVGENEELANGVLEKENALVKFIAVNEMNKKKVMELLALLIAIDGDSQNEIFFNCLRLAEERENLAKILRSKQSSNAATGEGGASHNKKDNDLNNNEAEGQKEGDRTISHKNNESHDDMGEDSQNSIKEKEILSQVEDLMDRLITIHLKNKILWEYEKNDFTITNSYQVTEVKGPVSSPLRAYFMIINPSKVKLYPIEGTAKISNANTKEIAIASIEKLVLYDTSRVVFIIHSSGEVIKLFFTSMLFSTSFIEEVRQVSPSIPLFFSNDLIIKINTVEATDQSCLLYAQEVNNRIKEKEVNKLNNTKAFIWKHIRKIWERSEQFRFTNSIEENLYYKGKKESRYFRNVFYIDNLDKTLVFNPLYLYVVSENSLFSSKQKPVFAEDDVVLDKDAWTIEEKVLYTDIKKVDSNFIGKELAVVHKKGSIAMKFKEKFEMYLIHLKLLNINEMVRDKWNIQKKSLKVSKKK